MPEIPPSHRRQFSGSPAAPAGTVALPYAELHCKTNFSFLEGASHPDELVARAAELGLSGPGRHRPQHAWPASCGRTPPPKSMVCSW